MTTINFQVRTIKHQINSVLKLIANGIKSYIDKLIVLEAKLESLQELLKPITYNLFKKDCSVEQFGNFEDLANAFLDEYGSYPSEPLKEGSDWYYQGTENKRKRRSKHDVFNEKWNALFANRDWIKANWHEFVMEYLVLMTSRKEHRDFTSGHYVTKTKTGSYSMHWKIYKDIGLNNLSANTAYSWTMRNGLRNLAIEGTRMRIELCADESGALKDPTSVAAQLRAEFVRNN